MIKKLIKYGNSNALVLDKAILELLDIPDGGSVKIKTDGQNLIISKAHLNNMNNKEIFASFTLDSNDREYIETSQPLFKQVSEEIQDIQKKYAPVAQKLEHNEAFFNAVQALTEKYTNSKDSHLYLQEFMKIRRTFFPELTKMDQEITHACQKIYAAQKQVD